MKCCKWKGAKCPNLWAIFSPVRDLLERGYHGAVIRYVYLMTHYRKPMDWSDAKAEEARKKIKKWTDMARTIPMDETAIYQPVLDALCDDLNTPLALARMDELVNLVARGEAGINQIKPSLKLLGLDGYRQTKIDGMFMLGEIPLEEIIEKLNAERLVKNFEAADWLRDELQEMGIILNIQGEKTTYSFKDISFTEEKSRAFQDAYHAKYPPK